MGVLGDPKGFEGILAVRWRFCCCLHVIPVVLDVGLDVSKRSIGVGNQSMDFRSMFRN